MTTLGTRLVPALLVRDMAATLGFYDRLGFKITGRDRDQEPATWAEVRRDGVVLQFHSEPPNGTPPAPVFSGTLYCFPSSVDDLAVEFLAAGVVFSWGPEVMDYGMKEFAIQDPNGYFIAFTEPEPPAAPGNNR